MDEALRHVISPNSQTPPIKTYIGWQQSSARQISSRQKRLTFIIGRCKDSTKDKKQKKTILSLFTFSVNYLACPTSSSSLSLSPIVFHHTFALGEFLYFVLSFFWAPRLCLHVLSLSLFVHVLFLDGCSKKTRSCIFYVLHPSNPIEWKEKLWKRDAIYKTHNTHRKQAASNHWLPDAILEP